MGVERCCSVNDVVGSAEPMLMNRSLSNLDWNAERYIQQNITDAEANMAQFEEEFVSTKG